MGQRGSGAAELYRLLAKVRKSSKVFRDGTLKFLYIDDNVIAFSRARNHRRKAVIIFINRFGSGAGNRQLKDGR